MEGDLRIRIATNRNVMKRCRAVGRIEDANTIARAVLEKSEGSGPVWRKARVEFGDVGG